MKLFCFALIGAAAGVAGCNSGSGGTPSAPIAVSITNKIATIAPGAAAVTFTASVQNDSTNSGVTWNLTVGGATCAPICGTLSGATATSVIYTPPSSTPASPDNAPTLAAQALKDPTKSDTDSFTIAVPTVISVAIANKFTTINAAAAPLTVTAQVLNDASNLGVTWSLTASGVSCSPACGTLSGTTSTTVIYTAPSSTPASPNNSPVLTATSVKDTAKSDSDAFTIIGLSTVAVAITNKFTSIPAASAPLTLTAQVQNDASNAGVTWVLTAAGSSCSPACGALTGQTATNVIYTPPATAPAAPANAPTITATSVKDTTKSDTDSFSIISGSLTVTITNKVNMITAGTAPITLIANVTNDPTNAGVLWQLNGCTASTCGTLGATTATTAVYNPPASTPAAPNDYADITAVSVRDGSKSDFDSIGIISGTVSSCAGTPTGHESLLSGQYAFFAQGQSAMAGSFSADGSGHFAALGSGASTGNLDIDNGSNAPQSIALVGSGTGSGFYTVGPDPAGVGDVGCLDLYGSDGSSRIFRISLGEESGGIATAGRITEYDDQGDNPLGIPTLVSGLLLRQDPAAFASGDTSHLQTNYAFGLEGAVGVTASMAGSMVLNPASGTITNSDFDSNQPGAATAAVQSDVQGSTGSITAVSALTGRALFQFTAKSPAVIPGPNAATQAAIYIVNANEFILLSLDSPGASGGAVTPGWIYAGRAIATTPAFSASSLSGNYVFHAIGSVVNLGVLTFSSGNVTGTIFGHSLAGSTNTQVASETYAVSPAFGRVTLAGTGLTNPPVFYLATPGSNTETIDAFASGTDPAGGTPAFGLLEPGAAASVSTASLAGNYYLGNESLLAEGTVNAAGVMGIGNSGAVSGTEFDSSTSPAFLSQAAVTGLVTIDNANGPGTGNVGINSVAITNGRKLFIISESIGAPSSIRVVDHQ
jgi:hypothetical protein